MVTYLLAPFALLLFAYFIGSAARLTDNPNDKLLPSAVQMTDAVKRMAFEEDKRSGGYLLWQDTASSLQARKAGMDVQALLVHVQAPIDFDLQGMLVCLRV